MKRLIVGLFTCIAVLLPALASGATYQLDPVHSSIQFKIRHLTISNVTGMFNSFNGVATIEGEDLSTLRIEVTIDAASIYTGNQKRDEHLKTSDFLDIAKYPTIKFVSTNVSRRDLGKLKVTGNLTFHGVTKEIVVDLVGPTPEIKDPWGNLRRGTAGSLIIDRREFGVTWNSALNAGGLVIGNEVTSYFEIEWLRKP
jgi:polyisoprenoid-binding protein YceI